MIRFLPALAGLFCLLHFSSFSQELSPERKIYTIKNLQADIFRLPYDLEYIGNTLAPETHRQRAQLAPHYPDVTGLGRDKTVIDQAFLNWVTLYPGEYEAYKNYLENFIRSHVGH